jgi:hypothetical protein
VLEKEKLNGTNFIDWYRNLGIVLRQEKIEYVLEEPHPDDLPNNADESECVAYENHNNDVINVSCLMLATLSPNLKNSMSILVLILCLRGCMECLRTRIGPKAFRMYKPKDGRVHIMDDVVFEEAKWN